MVTQESDVGAESYLLSIVSGLVDRPDKIKITKSSDDMGILLTLTVDKTECGLIIENYSNKINKMKKIIYTLSALLVIGAFLLAYYVNTHREVRPQPDFTTVANEETRVPSYCEDSEGKIVSCLKD